MRTLELTHTGLSKPVVEHLAMLLVERTVSLTDLDLTHAYIEDKGAKLLSRALHLNRSVVRLALPHNRLTSEAGVALSDALRLNRTITQAGASRRRRGGEGDGERRGGERKRG